MKNLESKYQEYLQAVADVKRERKLAHQYQEELDTAIKAQAILQEVAKSIQEQVHDRISSIVSRCLAVVYGDDAYQFQIRFDRKRGKTEAKLTFVRDGLEVEPLHAAGGGTVDVAAFALRIACLTIHQPQLRSCIVLDEPFRFVDQEKRENLKLLLETLSKELGLQIVMVTHAQELQTGKVVELQGR